MRNLIKYVMVFSFFLQGCIQDVDFDQVDDIEINTVHNVSLIRFDMEPSDFLDALENEVLTRSDTTDLPIFGGAYTVNFLDQFEMKYKFSNSFNRNISVQIEFLDEFNMSLFNLQAVHIDAAIPELEITQTFNADELQRVLYTERIVVKMTMSNGNPPLDPNQPFVFNSQMAALLYYKVKKADD